MKIEHRPQCHILAAPDGEYVTDIDCDCGATYYTLTSRIAKLEAALWVALNGVDEQAKVETTLAMLRGAVKG